MKPRIYVDPAQYYENLAAYCAEFGFTDVRLIRALLSVNEETIQEVEANPEAFEQRVREYAYGNAMNKLNLPEE